MWSDFVRGRSCADQKRMTIVMTRVLLQARVMDRTYQVMYNEIWKLQDKLRSEKGKCEETPVTVLAEQGTITC